MNESVAWIKVTGEGAETARQVEALLRHNPKSSEIMARLSGILAIGSKRPGTERATFTVEKTKTR